MAEEPVEGLEIPSHFDLCLAFNNTVSVGEKRGKARYVFNQASE